MAVLICNVPKLAAFYLPPSLAILKGGCNALGIKSKTVDFNIDFVDECLAHNIPYNEYMASVSKDNIPNDRFRRLVATLLSKWAADIVSQKPELLAISVFSHFSQYFAKQLCKAVKDLDSTIPIILGGSGITYSIASDAQFAIELQNDNLINFFINDDAEQAWPRFLSEFFSVPPLPINKNHLEISYSPDYSDYDIARYEKYRTTTGLIWVPITGSKGCIQNCTFCEIPASQKFTQRSAAQIVNEVRAASLLANNVHMHFTDSLVNGSLSAFDEMLDKLVELQKESINTFQWGGQFIIRQKRVDDWAKMESSGCRMLEIGIETGSDDLRFQMNKRFKNEDLIYALAKMEQHKIQCVLLMFCSYPTETEEQFNETLRLFTEIQRYSTSAIRAVQLNFSFCVFENTPLYNNRKSIKLQTTSDPAQWTCEINPTLDFKERVRRRLITQEHLENLGYKLASDTKSALLELVPNYMRYRNGQQYTFDEMVQEVLGRPTTIKYRF